MDKCINCDEQRVTQYYCGRCADVRIAKLESSNECTLDRYDKLFAEKKALEDSLCQLAKIKSVDCEPELLANYI